MALKRYFSQWSNRRREDVQNSHSCPVCVCVFYLCLIRQPTVWGQQQWEWGKEVRVNGMEGENDRMEERWRRKEEMREGGTKNLSAADNQSDVGTDTLIGSWLLKLVTCVLFLSHFTSLFSPIWCTPYLGGYQIADSGTHQKVSWSTCRGLIEAKLSVK